MTPFNVTVQATRYFSHPRRSKRRMFGLNLSFSEKKYQNSGLAPYGLGRTQAFQGKKFQNRGKASAIWVELKLFQGKSSKTQGDCR